MATYAIGDIQGCYQELLNLLGQIGFNPDQDVLWFTGDLVNRGPESLETLRFVKNLGDRALLVLGNHDLHLLAIASGTEQSRKGDTLEEVLAAPDCQALCHWLLHQPLAHYSKEFNCLLVHAGLPPQWTAEDALHMAYEVSAVLQSKKCIKLFANMYGDEPNLWQDDLSGWERLRYITNALTRTRFVTPKGKLEFKHKGNLDATTTKLVPWFKHPKRRSEDTNILFGHWASLQGATKKAKVIGLDTGCVWGGYLTAIRLEDGMRFSTPSLQHAVFTFPKMQDKDGDTNQ